MRASSKITQPKSNLIKDTSAMNERIEQKRSDNKAKAKPKKERSKSSGTQKQLVKKEVTSNQIPRNEFAKIDGRLKKTNNLLFSKVPEKRIPEKIFYKFQQYDVGNFPKMQNSPKSP